MAAAIGVAIGSGAQLFLSDVEAFATSPVFWAKMSDDAERAAPSA